MSKAFLNGLSLREAAAPGTPPAGVIEVYAKTDGHLYIKDDTVGERMLTHATEAYPFTMAGTLTTKVGAMRVYMEGPYVVDSVRASVGTAPTGASVIVDVNRNGTTIYTTQGNRPTIAVSTNTALGGAAANGTFANGDYLTVDVDQIGSTVAGADLVVVVRMRRTA